MERERSGEWTKRTKVAAQISLNGDASLLTLRKYILPYVKNNLSTGILIPVSKFAEEYQKCWCLLNHSMYRPNQYNE